MKKVLAGLLFTSLSVVALNEQMQVEYRRARESDILSILSLMKEAAFEGDKVLVLPESCRERFVRDLLNKERLFVAVVGNEVVATKKLFFVENAEKNELLNELHAVGEKARLAYRGKIGQAGSIIPSLSVDVFQAPKALDYGVCIYDGFDFTRKAYRGYGMNSKLFTIAFDTLASRVKDALDKLPGKKKISLLYGVTYANAGKNPGDNSDRTPGIARAFQSFLQRHIVKMQSETILLDHVRYHSFMPTFDNDCKPLPNGEKIPGYGCVLTYELKGSVA